MKLITVEKIYKCLRDEKPEIMIEHDTILKAKKPIDRMMEISENLGL
jgi:quinolinate synthase